MFVPDSQGVALAFAITSMICWGSWSNLLILVETKMEFELFYLDYSLGCFLTSIIFAFSLGTMTNDLNVWGPLTFLDNDFQVDFNRYVFAFMAGLLFNIANLCLCKGISMLGLALAFPLCIGTSMVLGTVLTYALDPASTSNPAFLFTGLAFAFLAVLVAAFMHSVKDAEKAQKEPLTDDVENDAEPKHEASMTRKLVICLVGGVFMGMWNPLVSEAEKSPGLSPYGEFFFYTLAVLLSSLVLVPLIIAFPMEGFEGKAVASVLGKYTKTTISCHIIGILAGFVWSVGTLTNAMAGQAQTADGTVVMNSATSYAIGQCANVAAIFWGIILWGEFTGTSNKVKGMVAAVIGLYVVAIAFCTLAN